MVFVSTGPAVSSIVARVAWFAGTIFASDGGVDRVDRGSGGGGMFQG